MQAYTFSLSKDSNSSWIKAKPQQNTISFLLPWDIFNKLLTMTQLSLERKASDTVFHFFQILPIALSILILFGCILDFSETGIAAMHCMIIIFLLNSSLSLWDPKVTLWYFREQSD